MELCVNDILYAISDTLDHVEKEVLGNLTPNHSKRVACISAFIGKKLGLNKYEILDLTTCALLHDNALTEYLQDEKQRKENFDTLGVNSHNIFISHCTKGEENMRNIPNYGNTTNVIKYHHEHVDGSGTFGLKADETPLYAKIIHLTDQIDVYFDLSIINEEKFDRLCNHMIENSSTLYCTNIVNVLMTNADIDMFKNLSNENLDNYMHRLVPRVISDFDLATISKFIDVFSKIIDYKSEFTQRHTTELTKKASFMCDYYGFDENTKIKFYVAAGLHDIGKLAVDTHTLEKPDKLTTAEFEHIKSHAYHTYSILSKIENIDDIVRWSSFHHEKLNGKGYPFGKKAEELDDKCRLMACLDIYQALREERPYKTGFTHTKTIEILKKLAQSGDIDESIVHDIDLAFI